MEVRLTPSIEQVIPPQISFNFEEIKEELAGKLQVYRNMVVTEGGIKKGFQIEVHPTGRHSGAHKRGCLPAD